MPATAASHWFIRGPSGLTWPTQRVTSAPGGLATGWNRRSGIYNKIPNKTLAYAGLESWYHAARAADERRHPGGPGVEGVVGGCRPGRWREFQPRRRDLEPPPPSSPPGCGTPALCGIGPVRHVYGFKGAITARRFWRLRLEMLNPDALAAVKAEFEERMKGIPV